MMGIDSGYQSVLKLLTVSQVKPVVRAAERVFNICHIYTLLTTFQSKLESLIFSNSEPSETTIDPLVASLKELSHLLTVDSPHSTLLLVPPTAIIEKNSDFPLKSHLPQDIKNLLLERHFLHYLLLLLTHPAFNSTKNTISALYYEIFAQIRKIILWLLSSRHGMVFLVSSIDVVQRFIEVFAEKGEEEGFGGGPSVECCLLLPEKCTPLHLSRLLAYYLEVLRNVDTIAVLIDNGLHKSAADDTRSALRDLFTMTSSDVGQEAVTSVLILTGGWDYLIDILEHCVQSIGNNEAMENEGEGFDRVCLHYCLALLSLLVKDSKGVVLLIKDCKRISETLVKIGSSSFEYGKEIKSRIQQIDMWIKPSLKLNNNLKDLISELASFTQTYAETNGQNLLSAETTENPQSADPLNNNTSESWAFSSTEISNLVVIVSLLEAAANNNEYRIILFSEHAVIMLAEILARTSKVLSMEQTLVQMSPHSSHSQEEKKKSPSTLDSDREREHLLLISKCLSLLNSILSNFLKPGTSTCPPFRNTPLLHTVLKLQTTLTIIPTFNCKTLGSLPTNLVLQISKNLQHLFVKWYKSTFGIPDFRIIKDWILEYPELEFKKNSLLSQNKDLKDAKEAPSFEIANTDFKKYLLKGLVNQQEIAIKEEEKSKSDYFLVIPEILKFTFNKPQNYYGGILLIGELLPPILPEFVDLPELNALGDGIDDIDIKLHEKLLLYTRDIWRKFFLEDENAEILSLLISFICNCGCRFFFPYCIRIICKLVDIGDKIAKDVLNVVCSIISDTEYNSNPDSPAISRSLFILFCLSIQPTGKFMLIENDVYSKYISIVISGFKTKSKFTLHNQILLCTKIISNLLDTSINIEMKTKQKKTADERSTDIYYFSNIPPIQQIKLILDDLLSLISRSLTVELYGNVIYLLLPLSTNTTIANFILTEYSKSDRLNLHKYLSNLVGFGDLEEDNEKKDKFIGLAELTLNFMELLLQNGKKIDEFKRFVGFPDPDQHDLLNPDDIDFDAEFEVTPSHPIHILIEKLMKLEFDEHKQNDLVTRFQVIEKINSSSSSATIIDFSSLPCPPKLVDLQSQRLLVKKKHFSFQMHFGENVQLIEQALNMYLPLKPNSKDKLFSDLTPIDLEFVLKLKSNKRPAEEQDNSSSKKPKLTFTSKTKTRDFRANPNTSRPPSTHVDDYMEMEKDQKTLELLMGMSIPANPPSAPLPSPMSSPSSLSNMNELGRMGGLLYPEKRRPIQTSPPHVLSGLPPLGRGYLNTPNRPMGRGTFNTGPHYEFRPNNAIPLTNPTLSNTNSPQPYENRTVNQRWR
eukprot:TRINITY_DN8836_c0_g1_i1.p1 TRINITY_DN8836_c0_g1~~TRINITY_DN8836_c0_g1_i1.p1  ORF type:complete len:1317 (-),score=318.92 TRINITY_DN8836_c0_g1_i1:37-3987(-)